MSNLVGQVHQPAEGEGTVGRRMPNACINAPRTSMPIRLVAVQLGLHNFVDSGILPYRTDRTEQVRRLTVAQEKSTRRSRRCRTLTTSQALFARGVRWPSILVLLQSICELYGKILLKLSLWWFGRMTFNCAGPGELGDTTMILADVGPCQERLKALFAGRTLAASIPGLYNQSHGSLDCKPYPHDWWS
jgi:hypothetical protein